MVVAVAPRAVRMTTVITSRAVASVVPHVVAMIVVDSAVALAAALLVVTTVAPLPVVKAAAVSLAVMTVAATVVLRRVVTVTVMAASLVLVIQAVVALLLVAMRVHRAAISLLASLHLPSLPVVVASPLWPTMPASVLHAPRADCCVALAPPFVQRPVP